MGEYGASPSVAAPLRGRAGGASEREIKMTITEENVLEFHRGGKVALRMPHPVKTVEDLCLAYTPGVGKAVLRLDRNPEEAFDYTAKGKTVAVVSDGTAILGLGDRGPTAAIPVMEGKCVLFKSFAGVEALASS